MKVRYKTVSIPDRELERLREIAEQEQRSLAGQVIYWIEQHVQQTNQRA